MKHFIKITIEGSFPGGVDEMGTYEVTEGVHESIRNLLELGVDCGSVRRV